jgi:hypothetical protein
MSVTFASFVSCCFERIVIITAVYHHILTAADENPVCFARNRQQAPDGSIESAALFNEKGWGAHSYQRSRSGCGAKRKLHEKVKAWMESDVKPLMDFPDETEWLLEEIIGRRYIHKVEANTNHHPFLLLQDSKTLLSKRFFTR